MSISTDIKQEHFFSPKQKVLINIIYTFNQLDGGIKEIVDVYDLLPQHYNVLKILKGAGSKPVTPGYVLDVMLDKTRDLTRIVDKLVKLGYVKREINAENRRSLLISLTKKGLDKTKEMEEKVNAFILSNVNLSGDECDNLSELLDKLRTCQELKGEES